MAGDIIIPKKNISSFMTGVFVTVAILFVIGGVAAATVFNAGGGQISNLGTPSADTDAATKAYVDAAGGGTDSFANSENFTASGTHTVASGVTLVYFTLVGGGGGGGGGDAGTGTGACGGGGGETLYRWPLEVQPGDVLDITVGSAGSGGAALNDGTDGGNTSLGARTVRAGVVLSSGNFTAEGGEGGEGESGTECVSGKGGGTLGGGRANSTASNKTGKDGSYSTSPFVRVGGGGGGGGGTGNAEGGDGGSTQTKLGGNGGTNTIDDAGGAGGASFMGAGGDGGDTAQNGSPGASYGGGGGGAGQDSSRSGGNGGGGYVIIEWN